ncbi:YihY/virulence factor BrkB family protein [Natronorarus salvus]|uniref:YihY/virulence factor BrkB family protein n=1 Tax=Natronorarus salvus TaxID=3117733 RepID=UPI002F2643A4
MDGRRPLDIARDVLEVIREHNVTFMAGSIAHAAFLSLLPLLLLLLIIAGAVGNEYLTERIVALSREYLSPAGENLVYEALTDASERAGASVIGVASLLWGMLRIFRGISTAFDELYGADESGFVGRVLDGLVVFLAIALATVGAGFAGALLAVGDHPVLQLMNPLVLVVGLMIAFFPIYYVFPEREVTPREVLPGTVVAAVGWVVLEVVFGLYVDVANTVSADGALGAVILLLVWLYGSAFVLLLGAVVNIVLAGHHREDADADGSTDATDTARAATG